MSFWNHMEMWEKMLLVLAATMLAVLIMGMTKLIWMKVQAKKYLKMVAEKKAAMEGNPSTAQSGKGDEIPFGIKALEAGIEVEGVVVSRPATPRTSFHNLSNLNLGVSDARDSYASLPSRASSTRLSNSGLAQAFSSVEHAARDASVQQPRPTYQPYLDSQNVAMPTLQSSSVGKIHSSSEEYLPGHLPGSSRLATLAKLEGKVPHTSSPARRSTLRSPYEIRHAQGSLSATPSRSPSPLEGSQSCGDNDEITPVSEPSQDDQTAARMARHFSSQHAQDRLVTADQQDDLSLLHSHRLSHAAEVGQLARRTPNQRALAPPQTVSTSGGSFPPSGLGHAVDLEHAVLPQGYSQRPISEGAITHPIYSPHEVDQSGVAYFEMYSTGIPDAQAATPDGNVMATAETGHFELDTAPRSPKRASKRLIKKSRAST